ncbi:MAG: TolC family protein, partial [Kiritimatiellae bacterium]|nr:TolC family protein [Kiritimatiellia bacterium]
ARGVATLFHGKRNLTQIDQAITDLRAARATVAETEQNLYQDLVKAVTQRDGARESSRVAQMVYDQAKENLSIVEPQYQIGTSSSVERTDAQVSVTEAHANVVTAFYDEQDAQAKIACLIGTLFSEEK